MIRLSAMLPIGSRKCYQVIQIGIIPKERSGWSIDEFGTVTEDSWHVISVNWFPFSQVYMKEFWFL
jgi:hypothetical protein